MTAHRLSLGRSGRVYLYFSRFLTREAPTIWARLPWEMPGIRSNIHEHRTQFDPNPPSHVSQSLLNMPTVKKQWLWVIGPRICICMWLKWSLSSSLALGKPLKKLPHGCPKWGHFWTKCPKVQKKNAFLFLMASLTGSGLLQLTKNVYCHRPSLWDL